MEAAWQLPRRGPRKRLVLPAGQAWEGGSVPCISLAPGRRRQSSRGWDRDMGPQSLSEPTAEDPFRFRLVGFGFVSSSSEALLEPDSSSALGG